MCRYGRACRSGLAGVEQVIESLFVHVLANRNDLGGGTLGVTLAPDHDLHSNLNLGILMNGVHQVFGRWSGCIPNGTDAALSIEDMLGFAEEARARW